MLYGYHYDFSEDGTKRYMMGTELPEGIDYSGDLTILQIPDHVEIGLGIMEVWRRIYSEWFPSSNFEQVEGPCIEKYYWIDEGQTESIFEVWIPINRKG